MSAQNLVFAMAFTTAFRAASRAWICIFVLLPMTVQTTGAQSPERLPSHVEISKNGGASCYDGASGKLVGSRLVRSPAFTSPDGRYRAYSEVEAVAFKVPEKDWNRWSTAECANTAKLFVAGPKSNVFRLVFLQEPTRYQLLNGIGLVDWSPDSRRLLLKLGLGQYASDWGGTVVLLYDADYGVFSQRELTGEAFNRYVGKDCTAVIEALGFSPEGKVLLKAGPYFDIGEDAPRTDSCVKKEGFWLLDAGKETVSPLPDDYKMQRYGKFQEDRSDK